MSPEDFISLLNYNFNQIHSECKDHETAIERSFLCGCFYCKRTFYPTEITDWLDDAREGYERTAECPKCGIDAVLPTSEHYEINNELLEAMYYYYFSGKFRP